MTNDNASSASVVHCRYHCTVCDACFASLDAFDRHRQGSHAERTRKCGVKAKWLQLRGLEAADGICRLGAHVQPQPQYGAMRRRFITYMGEQRVVLERVVCDAPVRGPARVWQVSGAMDDSVRGEPEGRPRQSAAEQPMARQKVRAQLRKAGKRVRGGAGKGG